MLDNEGLSITYINGGDSPFVIASDDAEAMGSMTTSLSNMFSMKKTKVTLFYINYNIVLY